MTGDALLRSIGVAGYARAAALDAKHQTLTLFDAAIPFEGVVCWTEYMGGFYNTRGGAVREAPWPDLGAQMLGYAKRVMPKGGGWWFTGAVSKNGGCRDADIESVTMLILDADGAGEWDAARELLHEAGLAYIAQRSSSHTPSIPKWHLLIPLAQPGAVRSTSGAASGASSSPGCPPPPTSGATSRPTRRSTASTRRPTASASPASPPRNAPSPTPRPRPSW